MSTATSPRQSIGVFARWRPLTEYEAAAGEIGRTTSQKENSLLSVSITRENSSYGHQWKSPLGFREVLNPQDDNSIVFNTVTAASLSRVLEGGTCSYFAYGHTGSGKTHTIIGYDYERSDQLGLCLAASRRLFESFDTLNEQQATDEKLGIGFSLYELRKNSAFDLLNGRIECHIRQGYDGKTHIRGPTEMLGDGKVRVRPIVQRPCWTYDALRKELQQGLDLRAVGSSSVHDQSSRTHAVLELEVISAPLIKARQALYDRESELVPVGKNAIDVSVEEYSKGVVLLPGGGWKPNPDYRTNQARIDRVNAEKAEFEARVAAAQARIASILSSDERPACLGGRLVFVDLAGAEYQHDKSSNLASVPKQTAQERQEGRQINIDLLALKEVIRACASGHARIPFRSSPLTMVLREHFRGSKDDFSAMIVTVSPAKDQYAATLNSLKYGSLVGVAAARVVPCSRDEYTAAYNQLLRTHNTNDNGTFPDDPGAEANATYVSEDHILALRSAIQVLTKALRAIERERKVQEEKNGQTENLLEFIASQELSSRALHQAMLRFVEYRDISSRELMRATEKINTFDDSSESHNLIRQPAILTKDRAIHDENWWSDRIVSLANMMAVQVQNEEYEQRMLQTQPRSVTGGNAEIGESLEDNDGTHEEQDEDDDFDTDEDKNESLPDEETDDTTNQSPPDGNVNVSLPHAEGDVCE